MKIRKYKDIPGAVSACSACKIVNGQFACETFRLRYSFRDCATQMYNTEFPDFREELA